MSVQLSVSMESDLVSPRELNGIRNSVNRAAGEFIVKNPLRTRFTKRLYQELPGVAQRRSKKYEAMKRRRYGHDTPNVLTGRLKKDMPATAKVTATASGGKVKLRAYWAGAASKDKRGRISRQGMRESQRQEFETLSNREKQELATSMEKDFTKQVFFPAFRRPKRRLKRAS